MDKRQMVRIPTKDLVTLMPLIEKYTRKAHESGTEETSYEQFVGKMFLGHVHVWAMMDLDDSCIGICTTEFADFDNYRCLHLITCGTDNKSPWEEWHHSLETFAKQNGCRNIQIWGRKGWSRALDKIDGLAKEKYRETYRVFSMELDYESV